MKGTKEFVDYLKSSLNDYYKSIPGNMLRVKALDVYFTGVSKDNDVLDLSLRMYVEQESSLEKEEEIVSEIEEYFYDVFSGIEKED